MQEYTALAQFTREHIGWLGMITLVTAWFWRMTLKHQKGGAGWLKATLAINNLVVGYLYFVGILTSGCTAWFLGATGYASNSMAFLFLVTGLFWLLDLTLGRTELRLPMSPLEAVWTVGMCTLGLIFPTLEWIFGSHFPYAQSFGSGSVPLLIFSAGLLGGTRPKTWLGKTIMLLVALSSLDAGLLLGLAGKHVHYTLAFVITCWAVIATWSRLGVGTKPEKGREDGK